MPIAGYTGIVAFGAIATLVAGIFLLLRADAIARRVETPDNDIVATPGRRGRGGRGLVLAGWLFVIGSVAALGVLILVATGVIDSSMTRTDPTVQRP